MTFFISIIQGIVFSLDDQKPIKYHEYPSLFPQSVTNTARYKSYIYNANPESGKNT